MSDDALFILMFTGIWCLVGAVFLAVGLSARRRRRLKEERLRARASGTVVEVVRRSSGDSVSFYPIVEFEFDGRRISLESETGGGRKRYYEGQAVEVLYDPDDPACFRLENDNAGLTVSGILLAVGIACVAIGALAALVIGGLRTGLPIHFNVR